MALVHSIGALVDYAIPVSSEWLHTSTWRAMYVRLSFYNNTNTNGNHTHTSCYMTTVTQTKKNNSISSVGGGKRSIAIVHFWCHGHPLFVRHPMCMSVSYLTTTQPTHDSLCERPHGILVSSYCPSRWCHDIVALDCWPTASHPPIVRWATVAS